MAKVETIRLVDDITGGDAAETVGFGLDGRRFEIDLTADNAAALREALAPFLGVARAAGSPRTGRNAGVPAQSARRSGASGSDTATREHNRAVRAWARENGWTLSERGRIPSEVVEAHRRAQDGGAASTATPAPAAEAVPEATPEAETRAEAPAKRRKPSAAPAVEFSG
ncbi:histone-like nucleoid-structuring protein Lsr2 [Pseudonocardia sp. HH130629-09]|uniref:histone-like nucleoid-structuring protein Lsr2 n=1 Tax=Pseudonocardia sp. HH130629-09 TaxID=1641402 RepID=UPI0007DC22BE